MKTTTTICLILLVLVLAPLVSWAQTTPNPPGQISYQGFLTDASGIPLATNAPRNYTVTFRIYDASTGGHEKWAEQQVVTVDRGYFTVLLGNGSAIDANFTSDLTGVFSGPTASDRYLGMTVAELGGNEIAPRLRLLASPYALLAQNANTLISPNGASLVTSANGQLTVNGSITGDGSGLTSLNANRLTTGTLPNARLSGTYSSALNLNNAANGFNGSFNGNGSGLTSLNASRLTTGTVPDAQLSGNVALKGSVNTFAAKQVFNSLVGIGTASPAYTLDVNGSLRAAAGFDVTGGYTHLNNSADNSKGNVGVGNAAYTNVKLTINTTEDYGIFVDPGAKVDAAYFDGNVFVHGTLSKSAGSFKIDHPLDPAHKWLYHSFVESPDMMDVYNGNVVTDAGGKATVTLPSYFEALNKDFRYQLTVIGQFAQAIVSSEVSSNAFVIKTDKPNVKVSWQVTGIRHDAFANAHRIIPEVPKTGNEVGKYMDPLEHGKPASMGMKLLHSKD